MNRFILAASRARKAVYEMDEKERLSLGLSHAGQRLFLETIDLCSPHGGNVQDDLADSAVGEVGSNPTEHSTPEPFNTDQEPDL